ncbi:MAG: acyl--CoA ligase [Planctomycetales bacterium]|nr:acyl--CoA ligase [Planctomycetales bacterium]
MPNCVEAVVTTLACYQIGAIAVPLNHRYVAEEVADVVRRVDALLIVCDAGRNDVAGSLLEAGNIRAAFCIGEVNDAIFTPFDVLLDHDPLDRHVAMSPGAPALILFTSGSTGRPKGVVHSHAGAFAAIDASRRLFEMNDSDVVLVGKPISHAGGLETQLLPALHAGARVVLAMKPSPAEAVSLIGAHSVTQYGMLASDLLDFVEFLEGCPVKRTTLKNSIGSGDAVPHDLHQRFRDLFGWEVMEGCGMTEVGGYYAANPRSGRRKWGSLGLPVADTQIRIVNAEMSDVDIGQVGEIVIQAASQTIGYWQDVAATAELLRNGWLHTGDLGYRDDDGYVWFVGRSKLMIVRRGSNIAPAEVEDVLDEHPQVHASVVVGMADDRDGHVPVACVALLPGHCVSESELREFVASRLAAYKNPTRYFFFDELPRNGTGKFDRHRLQEFVDRAADDHRR